MLTWDCVRLCIYKRRFSKRYFYSPQNHNYKIRYDYFNVIETRLSSSFFIWKKCFATAHHNIETTKYWFLAELKSHFYEILITLHGRHFHKIDVPNLCDKKTAILSLPIIFNFPTIWPHRIEEFSFENEFVTYRRVRIIIYPASKKGIFFFSQYAFLRRSIRFQGRRKSFCQKDNERKKEEEENSFPTNLNSVDIIYFRFVTGLDTQVTFYSSDEWSEMKIYLNARLNGRLFNKLPINIIRYKSYTKYTVIEFHVMVTCPRIHMEQARKFIYIRPKTRTNEIVKIRKWIDNKIKLVSTDWICVYVYLRLQNP